jgi:hypothetical protein
MKLNLFPLSTRLNTRVYLISALAGFIGSNIVFGLLGGREVRMSFFHGMVFIPPSIITWIFLVHFLTRGSILRVVVAGAISPIVGCLSGMIYFGAGLFWLDIVIPFIWLFASIGIVTSLLIFLAVRRDLPPGKLRAT